MVIEKVHSQVNGRIFPNPHTTCWPDGVPGALGLRNAQILQTPEQITIIYRSDNQVRRIYLNQAHSDPVTRGWYGESIGHLEDDTLVVDTIGFIGKPQAMIDRHGTPVTEDLHVVERYRLLDGGEAMQIDVTVEDPNIFKKPWSMTWNFTRRGLIYEEFCAESNRDLAELIPIARMPDS